jgi:quinone-modifying oxidoreductase, subunit QmoA
MTAPIATNQTVLVVGGGIAGMTAALEAAECGKQVILVEKTPTLGGRTAQLYRYFPKMCHPTCGLEINLQRVRKNPNVRVMTMTEVTAVTGERGNYSATLRIRPRYVNENCTACGDCGRAVETEVPDAFNYGLGKVKAAYLPHLLCYPQRYVIDPSIIGTDEAEKAKAACKFNAIDLDMQEETVDFNVGAVIWATGWRPYDAAKILPYGYGRFRNVVSSVEFERLADKNGPTGGKILRPSDGKEAKNIAFIQCAGSRDENHLRHCSRICCMASLKQTQYVREAYGDEGKSTIYYIDMRVIDRLEDFYRNVKSDSTVSFVKSKVARIAENEETGDLILHGVDTEGYHRYAAEHDLVVLAVGMEPEVKGVMLPEGVIMDSSGFIEGSEDGGMFGAGSASSPLDVNRAVQNATASSLRAIQVIHKSASTEAV